MRARSLALASRLCLPVGRASLPRSATATQAARRHAPPLPLDEPAADPGGFAICSLELAHAGFGSAGDAKDSGAAPGRCTPARSNDAGARAGNPGLGRSVWAAPRLPPLQPFERLRWGLFSMTATRWLRTSRVVGFTRWFRPRRSTPVPRRNSPAAPTTPVVAQACGRSQGWRACSSRSQIRLEAPTRAQRLGRFGRVSLRTYLCTSCVDALGRWKKPPATEFGATRLPALFHALRVRS
jgi:hypothetical protein